MQHRNAFPIRMSDAVAIMLLIAGTQLWFLGLIGALLLAVTRPYLGILAGAGMDIAYGLAPFFWLPIPFTIAAALAALFSHLVKNRFSAGERRIKIGY